MASSDGRTESGQVDTEPWQERIELKRRLVHAGGTVFPVPYLLGWVSWTETVVLLVGFALVVGTMEFLRLGVGVEHPLFDALTRPYEQHSVGGYVLYMISIAGVAAIFAPSVAIPAILMLTLADPISGALGRNAADEPKRPLVWVVTFLVCVAIALPFTVPAAGSQVGVGVAAAVVGAAGATVADGLPPLIRGVPVDDNITIPPAAAVGIGLVLQAL
ncbi:dolichol kinase [Haloparvum sp. AD34]